MMRNVRTLGFYAMIPALAVSCSLSNAVQMTQSAVPTSGRMPATASRPGDLEAMLRRYATDRSALRRYYDAPASSSRSRRFKEFYAEWSDFLDRYSMDDAPEAAEPSTSAPGTDIAPEQPRRIAARIRAAVEIGNVTDLTRLAAELSGKSGDCARCGEEIARLAKAFDFDALTALAENIEHCGTKEN